MRARRTDGAHKDVLKRLRAMGHVCRSLHAAGDGLEDILVAMPKRDAGSSVPFNGWWLLVEVKTIERESTGYYRHTPAQEEWYDRTAGMPRIIVFGADDAQAKISRFL